MILHQQLHLVHKLKLVPFILLLDFIESLTRHWLVVDRVEYLHYFSYILIMRVTADGIESDFE